MAIRVPRSSLKWSFLVLAFFVGMFFLFFGSQDSNKEKNAKQFSRSSNINDYAFADILTITPHTATAENGKRSYSGFFCTCETVNGKEINIYISVIDFKTNIDSSKDWYYIIPDKVVFDTPLRILGRVTTYNNIIKDSKDNSRILRFDKIVTLTN